MISGSIMTIGRSFVQVSEDKNQAEAEYRYTLTRVRENGESIAVLGGEDEERSGVDTAFTKVLRSWRDICVQTMRTTIVSQTSGFIAPVLPIILFGVTMLLFGRQFFALLGGRGRVLEEACSYSQVLFAGAIAI